MICCLQVTHFSLKDTQKTKSEGMEKRYSKQMVNKEKKR